MDLRILWFGAQITSGKKLMKFRQIVADTLVEDKENLHLRLNT